MKRFSVPCLALLLTLGGALLGPAPASAAGSWYTTCLESNTQYTRCSDSWWNAISRCCREKAKACKDEAGSHNLAGVLACTTLLTGCTGDLSVNFMACTDGPVPTDTPISLPASVGSNTPRFSLAPAPPC